MRRLGVAVVLPLVAVAAGILWWIAGSDIVQTRWISLGVIVLAGAGWYLSREREG